jgi:hypothetical protein
LCGAKSNAYCYCNCDANSNSDGHRDAYAYRNAGAKAYSDTEACADPGAAPDSLALFRSLTLELAKRFASSSKGQ